MNFILHVVKIEIAGTEHPFVTTFDSEELTHQLQYDIKEKLIYKLLGVEEPEHDFEDNEQPEIFDTPKRGPGRPRKNS